MTTTAGNSEIIAQVELFKRLDRVALARLIAYFETVVVSDGEDVFHEGDESDSLYVVAEGAFRIYASGTDKVDATGLETIGPGDCFGEMGLITDEPRSATVRSRGQGRLLRLERSRFVELMAKEPSVATAVSRLLTHRLRAANRALVERDQMFAQQVDQVLATLTPERRLAVLELGMLEIVTTDALRALFGEDDAEAVATDLASMGMVREQVSPVIGFLRERLEGEVSKADLEPLARQVGTRLAAGECWDQALGVLARYGQRELFVRVLASSVRAVPPLADDRRTHWVERLSDDEITNDAELSAARAAAYEERGDIASASRILRRALGAALQHQDSAGGQLVSSALARLSSQSGDDENASAGMQGMAQTNFGQLGSFQRRFSGTPKGVYIAGAAFVLAAPILNLTGSHPGLVFVALLVAASVLWLSDIVPSSAVSLGLVVAWILLGIATPALALSGFGTLDWVFVLTVLGLGAAIARSGLLFRVGLLLVRRMPSGLFWGSSVMMVTGILLGPLLPASAGRAALTAPLAVAVSEALRLPPRSPGAAMIGLSAWLGAGPMRYLFLNSSTAALLAWGLLPEASRIRFDWSGWFLGALPFGLFVSVVSFAALYLILRPKMSSVAGSQDVDVQLAVLGPPSRKEWTMVIILALTVIGWFLAPIFNVHVAVIAIMGFVAAASVGNLDKKAMQDLDPNLLILMGIALSTAKVAQALGLDTTAADAIGGAINRIGASPVVFLVGVGVLTVVARLVLGETQTVLFLGLALIPVAPAVGVEPWLVVLAIISASQMWLIPTQNQAYLAALTASEGRLYSPAQARMVGFAYTGVTLLGLAVGSFYWHLRGWM